MRCLQDSLLRDKKAVRGLLNKSNKRRELERNLEWENNNMKKIFRPEWRLLEQTGWESVWEETRDKKKGPHLM